MITTVGTFCGFRNLRQIHEWADNEKITSLLSENFGVTHVPSYYWLTSLLKIIDPVPFSECFTEWVRSLLGCEPDGLTVAIDGKTVRSTAKMEACSHPLHIVSAQLSEMGLSLAQEAVEDKTMRYPQCSGS